MVKARKNDSESWIVPSPSSQKEEKLMNFQ